MSRVDQHRFVLFAAVVVAAATFIVYSAVLHNDFIGWDDAFYVLNSPFLLPLSPGLVGRIFSSFYFGSYSPLALLSHTVDFNIWGMDPRGHHLTNLVFHAANACLVYMLALGFFRRHRLEAQGGTGGDDGVHLVYAAAFAALAFALHPIRVESVACVSSRKDVLSAFLVVGSLLAYIRDAEQRGVWAWRPWYMLSLMLFALSLFAKGSGMSFPGVLFMMDLALDGGWVSWRRILVHLREKLPFLAAGIGAAALAYTASEVANKPDIGVRVLPAVNHLQTGLYNLAFYVGKTIWPVQIAELYLMPEDWRSWFAGGVALLVTVAALVAFLRGKYIWGVVWGAYVAAMLPMAGFVPASIQLISNRYAYFATIPFSLLAGFGVLLGLRRSRPGSWVRTVLWVLPGIVLVLFAWLTIRQIPTWRGPESVWRTTIEVTPEHCVAYLGLGNALQEQGEIDSAIVYFRQALQINPAYDRAVVALGGAYVEKKDTAEAERWLQYARRRLPGYSTIYVSLGSVRVLEGRYDDADSLYAKASALDPTNFVAVINRAVIALKRDDESGAVAFLHEALRINPNYADAYFLLGRLQMRKEETKEEGYALVQRAASLGSLEAQKLLLGLGRE
jgi:tetratricopeptide (TPR) repeat protein